MRDHSTDDSPVYGSDNSDDREVGFWKTRYPDPEARRQIRLEAWILAVLFVSVTLGMYLLWLRPLVVDIARPSDVGWERARFFLLPFLSGILGGTCFDIKWLYHSVARAKWNIDRRLWRLFTPMISGALALATAMLFSSGFFGFLATASIESPPAQVSFGFLVGYFSDSAIGKLRELAESLFGRARRLPTSPSSSA